MNYAAMDIGSNSLRLLVASPENGEIRPLLKRRRIVRLAEGLAENGALNAQRMELAISVIAEFHDLAKQNDAFTCAFATSAVRDAKNGGEFADRVKSETGVPVDILSGEDEAKITLLGAVGGFSPAVLTDIGGGSTELVASDGASIITACSVPCGCVRAKNIFSAGCSQGEVERWLLEMPLGSAAGETFGSALSSACANTDELVLSGGSCTIAAAYALGERREYDGQSAGKTLDSAVLSAAADRLWSMSPKELAEVPLLFERADTIIYGCALMRGCLEASSVKRVKIASGDNLEGYIKLKKQ